MSETHNDDRVLFKNDFPNFDVIVMKNCNVIIIKSLL